tara:strand:- start:71 stop:583 length:513 start_codon:yes stop_codon:yes gene_type:complete
LELINKIKELGEDKFIYTSSKFRLITIFDEFYQKRNDFDHLTPEQRRYLTTKFLASGIKQDSGSVFSFEGKSIKLLKSVGIRVNPLKSLIPALEKNNYLVVTPLTCFLYYLSLKASEDDIFGLLKKCPVNLKQAIDFALKEDYGPYLKENMAHYKDLQAEYEINHKYKKL